MPITFDTLDELKAFSRTFHLMAGGEKNAPALKVAKGTTRGAKDTKVTMASAPKKKPGRPAKKLKAAPAKPAKKTTAKSAVTKKAGAKAALKKAVAKTAAKKTTAAKTALKKPAVKKATAKKITAKKAVAQKAVAKKTLAKKASAKKASVSKPSIRKPAKKATSSVKPAAKAAVKKAVPAKKTAAKKAVASKSAAVKKVSVKKAPAKKATSSVKPAAKASRSTTASRLGQARTAAGAKGRPRSSDSLTAKIRDVIQSHVSSKKQFTANDIFTELSKKDKGVNKQSVITSVLKQMNSSFSHVSVGEKAGMGPRPVKVYKP